MHSAPRNGEVPGKLIERPSFPQWWLLPEDTPEFLPNLWSIFRRPTPMAPVREPFDAEHPESLSPFRNRVKCDSKPFGNLLVRQALSRGQDNP